MNISQGRLLFRRLAQEQNPVVVPDDMVDQYLDAGLEATNDVLGYHVTDGSGSTGVTLAADTQDYILPTACLRLLWVEWNGVLLAETDQDELRKRNINWRQAAAGFPAHYLLFGRKISFYPKPDALAVAASSTPILRYVSTPASYTLSGFAQLATAHHRIPVLWAVAEWQGMVNKDERASAAAMTLWKQRVEAAADAYADRMQQKG